MKKAEDLAKHCREVKKEGLPEPKSFEASVLEIEGREDPHWLNKLMDEEEEEVPPVGGESKAPSGGPQIPRAVEGAPYIIVDERKDEAPQAGSVAPGPQEGEKPTGGAHRAPEGLRAPTEPRPRPRVEAEVSPEAPKVGPRP